MSRALLLKRHIIDSESQQILDFATRIKPDPDAYYRLSKSTAEQLRLYGGDHQHHHHHQIYPIEPIYTEPLYLSAPLDLSLKSTHSSTPITPPSTPKSKTEEPSPHVTPSRVQQQPSSQSQPAASRKSSSSSTKSKKQKANRKLNFDEDKSSPVSGTIIRDRSELSNIMVQKGDIDPMYNVVVVTERAKAELAKIENKIGDYVCKLCNEMYKDAFSLAQHRCSCIIHIEYKCPECDKVFNCPANLASHRRWHKPNSKASVGQQQQHHQAKSDELVVDLQKKTVYHHHDRHAGSPEKMELDVYDPRHDDSGSEGEMQIPCPICRKLFNKQTYLRQHLSTHHISEIQDLQHSMRPGFNSYHHIAAN